MNAPSGCEALPPVLLGLPMAAGTMLEGEEGAITFEQALEEETGETSATQESETEEAEEPKADAALPLLPFFTSPLILFVPMEVPTTPEAEVAREPAEPKAVEHKLPPLREAAPPLPEQIAEKAIFPKEKPHGMPAAQKPSMVFTNSNSDQAAAEKVKQPLVFEYFDSPGFEKHVTVELAGLHRPLRQRAEAVESAIPLSGSAGTARLDPGLAARAVAPAEEMPRLALKTADEIGGHVQFLKSTGQNRLEVVLRPDGATQLHLEITRADGLIQVRASCEKGDFAALDGLWTNVQSSLAAHGMRVEPLQAAAAWDPNSPGRHGSPPREQERPTRAEYIFEQNTPAKTPGRQTSKPASWPSRGWQRWA